MRTYIWDEEKNAWLLAHRGVRFEMVVEAALAGRTLGEIDHPSPRYPGQKILIVEMTGYVYLVPFRESEETAHLITIIPSRKAKKRYGKNRSLKDV